MAASAVHYYFPSRCALTDALAIDGFAELAMCEVVTVLFALIRDCTLHGDIDIPAIESGIPPPLREQFTIWRQTADGIGDLPAGALAACMFCYSRLHGAITLELAGHLPPQLADRDALLDLQMAHTAEALHRPGTHPFIAE